jgi:type III secretion system FlhB-like substrate exporter
MAKQNTKTIQALINIRYDGKNHAPSVIFEADEQTANELIAKQQAVEVEADEKPRTAKRSNDAVS